MKRSKRLAPILKLATKAEQQAAALLGNIQQRLNTENQRLSALSIFRGEYIQQFNQKSATGIDVMTIQHYQNFINTLDKTIKQVSIQIQQTQQEFDLKKQNWIIERHKAKGIETVIDKFAKQESQQQAKHDQAEQDELSRNNKLNSEL